MTYKVGRGALDLEGAIIQHLHVRIRRRDPVEWRVPVELDANTIIIHYSLQCHYYYYLHMSVLLSICSER